MIRARPSFLLERVLRRRVCVFCDRRPGGSEALPDDAPRPCQDGCAVFENIQALQKIVADASDDPELDLTQRMVEVICQRCHLSTTAGAACSGRRDRTCPLIAQGQRVVAALEPLVEPAGMDLTR